MSESLNKRLAYLAIADMDYLSARLLLLSGLTLTGLQKASDSFEKLLKLFLLLEAKINKEVELDTKELVEFKHQLAKLFDVVRKNVPAKFDDTWSKYFQQLEDSYKFRYPESWKEAQLINDLETFDKAYSYLRNNIIANFPKEENKKVMEFGGFIYRQYSTEIIQKIKNLGGLTPKDIFYKNNKSAKAFDIDFIKL